VRTVRKGAKRRAALRFVAAMAFAMACGTACIHAQDAKPANPKCKVGSKDPACTPTPPPSAASDNPFPVDDSRNGSSTTPGQAGKTPAAPASTASDNPFPVEDSKHGAKAPGNNNFPDMPTTDVPDPPASSEKPMKIPPGGYSSSSGGDDAPSSSSSHHSDDDDVAPTTAAPNAPVKASALKDYGSHGDMSAARAKLEKTRIQDDLKIGSFYMKDGNTQGAYLRFKDAVDHDPEDPDARYSLAEAASKLNKKDEAILNYRECLKIDPAGDHDKASRKALEKLGATAQ
jgi:hypothetical protein